MKKSQNESTLHCSAPHCTAEIGLVRRYRDWRQPHLSLTLFHCLPEGIILEWPLNARLFC